MLYMKRKMRGHKCEVSLIAGAVGFAATAAAVATVGAGVATVGALTGTKALTQVGGLMMGGGMLASGAAGLGMVGGVSAATGTLGTLSAGATLVGGAMTAVGTLTGNSKMAGIGALIGGAGMIGTSFANSSASVTGSSASKAVDGATTAGEWKPDYGLNTASNAPAPVGGLSSANAPIALPQAAQAAGGLDSMMAKLDKYNRLIEVGGKAASSMMESKTANDFMAQKQQQFDQQLAYEKSLHPNGAVTGSVGVSAPAVQQYAQRVSPVGRGLLNTGV